MNDAQPNAESRRRRLRKIIEIGKGVAFVGVSIVIILKSAATFWVIKPESKSAFESIQPVMLDLSRATTTGAPTAAIGIVMFSDFECAFCAAFSRDVLPTLKKQYVDSGQVRIAFKQFPLVGIHPEALRMAQLTSCLPNQEAFWRAHDLLFEQSRSLASVTSASLASAIGVEAAGLERCMPEHGRRTVDTDVQLGQALGLHATPTFFVGLIQGTSVRSTRRLKGFGTVSAFADVLADVRKHRQ